MYRNCSQRPKAAINTPNNFMNLAGEFLICQKNIDDLTDQKNTGRKLKQRFLEYHE